MTGKLLISAALLCAACGRPDLGLPPIVREGERVALGTDVDVEVCAGTLALLDAHVASVEAALGVTRKAGKVQIYVFGKDEDVHKRCGAEVSGCFVTYESGGPAVIVGAESYDAVYHEVVHDICQNSEIGRPPDWLAEAIAFALGGSDSFAVGSESCPVGSERSLDELFDRFFRNEYGENDGQQVGRFILHLLKAYGPQKLVAWAKGLHWKDNSQAIRQRFEQTYGRSIDDEWAIQDVTASRRASPDCLLAPKLAWREGRAEHTFTTSCEDPAVETLFNAPEFRRSRVIVERSTNDTYYLELDGSIGKSVVMHLCGTCPFITQIDLAEHDYRESGFLPLLEEDQGQFLVTRLAKVASDGPLRVVFGLWPPPPECDVRENNCPSGEKCQFFSRNRLSCQPLRSDPLPEGAVCDLLKESADPCEIGFECPIYSAHCVPLCAVTEDTGCKAGEICLWSDENYPGVCMTECDPLGQSCPAGQLCAFFNGNFLCSNLPQILGASNSQVGDECAVVCGQGLHCASSEAAPECAQHSESGCCTPYCDLTADEPTAVCSPGQARCAPLTDTIGYCSVE